MRGILDGGKRRNGHAGARTQDLGVISTALYQLSYATDQSELLLLYPGNRMVELLF